MEDIKIKSIMGRLTGYIPDKTLINDGANAAWEMCEGEPFDLIYYDPNCKILKQALLHEEFHAVLERIGFHQAGVSHEIEEMMVDALSTFICENYEIKEK